MSDPYAQLPDHCFWYRSVSNRSHVEVDPIVNESIRILQSDKVATVGGSFAQEIARALKGVDFGCLVVEDTPSTAGAKNENYGVYPARFGSIDTPRQLLQLFDRAYGLLSPKDNAWRSFNGGFIDPFRPRIQSEGFRTLEDLENDRASHLAAVRRMFEECNVLVFSFGLTESWECVSDGAVFPLPPSVVAKDIDAAAYQFRNFTVYQMESDMRSFIEKLRQVNRGVRLILAVSPESIMSTYESRHVLESAIYTKSALRVVAEQIVRNMEDVTYFPSYEIVSGPQARSQFFEEDLREVSPEGVSYVLSLFTQHFLSKDGADIAARSAFEARAPLPTKFDAEASILRLQSVICDEEAIDPGSHP